MEKRGNEHIVCTYCTEDALPGTNPPVCEKHNKQDKKASDEPKTLKELDS